MTIRFIHAGCGDAIHIRFEESPAVLRNIIIDGGTELGDIYVKGLQPALQGIINNKEKIDLWIITHIDDDHVGGILRLLKDDDTLNNLDMSQTMFWYNCSIWDYDTGVRADQKKNVGQAVRLRDWLMSGSPVNQLITDAFVLLDFWGVKFHILSPNQKMMERLLNLWEKEETKIREKEISSKKVVAAEDDYECKIEDFELSKEFVDHDEANNSSIAFALEYQDERFLFTADANAATLSNGLERMGKGNKIIFKYVQVPHHGSKYNISDRLLSLIDCNEFIITGDAFNRSALPNKFAMAKILKARDGQKVTFHLTAKNQLTENIFKVDTDKTIGIKFPEVGTNYLEFKLGDPSWKE